MRDITIDLRGAEAICSSYSIGRDGENNATEFVVKFPDKLVGYNVIFEFFHESGWKYSSEVFPYAREIIYSLPDRVVSAGELTLSIVCVKGSNIYKPFERTFVVQESIGVNENEGVELEWIDDHERRISDLEESDNEGFIANLNIRVADGADEESFLYDADYSSVNFNYEWAEEYLSDKYFPSGMCSAIRKGDYVGRNFDWYYDNAAEVIIRTSEINGRHKSVGIAQYSPMTREKIQRRSGEDITDFKILPFFMTDGINSKGVYCNVNVISGDRGRTTGTNPEGENLCALSVVRFVLDYANSAFDAVSRLAGMNIWCPHTETLNEEYHWLIADKESTYIVEIVDNEMVYHLAGTEAILTNFSVVSSNGLEWFDGDYTSREESTEFTPFFRSYEHPMGVERFDILKSGISEITDVETMKSLLQSVSYSRTYSDAQEPYWYSEASGNYETYGNLAWGTPLENYSGIKADMQRWYQEGQLLGIRDGKTWHSVHSVVYDLNKLEAKVWTQEDYTREISFGLTENNPSQPSEEITEDDILLLMKETELIDGVLATIVDDEEYLLVTDDGEEKAIFI